MKEHPYIGELGHFTAYVRTNLPYARTQRFARNTPYTAVPPRRAHYTLQTAGLKVSSWVITLPQKCLLLAADSPVHLCERLSVRRIHIAHRRCEQGFQGAQNPWHTTLVQSLVCYTFPEVYTFLKCKKPHANTLTVRTWDLMLPRPSRVLRNQS